MKSTNKIKEKKIETTIIELSRGLPLQFQKLFESIRNIGFEDTPDYSLLRTLLAEMFNEKGYENDFMYDWIIKSQKIAKQNKIHSQLIDRSKDDKIDNHNLKVRNENEHINHKRPNNEDSNQIDIQHSSYFNTMDRIRPTKHSYEVTPSNEIYPIKERLQESAKFFSIKEFSHQKWKDSNMHEFKDEYKEGT